MPGHGGRHYGQGRCEPSPKVRCSPDQAGYLFLFLPGVAGENRGSGGKSGTLTLNKVRAKNAGTYTVTATNTFGSATSTPAVLTVVPAP